MTDKLMVCLICYSLYHHKGKCDQCGYPLRDSDSLSEDEWEDIWAKASLRDLHKHFLESYQRAGESLIKKGE